MGSLLPAVPHGTRIRCHRDDAAVPQADLHSPGPATPLTPRSSPKRPLNPCRPAPHMQVDDPIEAPVSLGIEVPLAMSPKLMHGPSRLVRSIQQWLDRSWHSIGLFGIRRGSGWPSACRAHRCPPVPNARRDGTATEIASKAQRTDYGGRPFSRPRADRYILSICSGYGRVDLPAQNIDITVIAVPLGAGVVGILFSQRL